MSERDFKLGSVNFKLNKLDPFKQFHLIRRLTPILSEIVPIAKKLSGSHSGGEDQFESLIPIFNGLGKLSDEDANKVFLGLLSAVEMQQASGGWARVAADNNLMFHDLELPILLQIAGRAFAYNLKGFLAVLPQVSPARG